MFDLEYAYLVLFPKLHARRAHLKRQETVCLDCIGYMKLGLGSKTVRSPDGLP